MSSVLAIGLGLFALTQVHAEPSIIAKDRVSATVHRGPSKAIVCLSARAPVHLSGEYGVHVNWAPNPGKEIELYSKADYFPVPLRVEVPLPREARSLKVEVGACVENDYCDSVELKLELRKAAPEPSVDSIDCKTPGLKVE